MARVSAADRAESIDKLRTWLQPGDTVTTVLRSVSRSGMSRSIDLYAFACDDGQVSKRWLSYHVARVVGGWDDRRECVKVSGAGMDMGFHLVYTLSGYLWPDGFTCTGDRCPSNAHTNGQAYPHAFPAEHAGHAVDPLAPCPVYHRGREGDRCGMFRNEHPTAPGWHGSGGYALRHEWLG